MSYVRNSFDFLRDWNAGWSPRTKQYARDFCFTAESETGKRIARDYTHEKNVRLLREGATGKTSRSGHQLKIEHGAVLGIQEANQNDKRHAMSNLSGNNAPM